MAGAVRWGHLVVAVAVRRARAVRSRRRRTRRCRCRRGPPAHVHRLGRIGHVGRAIAAFEAAAGGGDNGTVAGEQSSGFRHVNWDGWRSTGAIPARRRSSPAHVIVAVAQPAAALGTRARARDRGLERRLPVGLERHVHAVQRAERVGAVQLRHGRVRRRRSGGPGEHADAGADPRARDRVPEQHAHRPRSSTTTADILLRHGVRSARLRRRSPACCSRPGRDARRRHPRRRRDLRLGRHAR